MYDYHKGILIGIARMVDAAKSLDLHLKTLEMDYRHLHEDFEPQDNPDDDEYLKIEESLESMRHQINLIVLGAAHEAASGALKPGFPYDRKD